jgi:hypothetical protein
MERFAHPRRRARAPANSGASGGPLGRAGAPKVSAAVARFKGSIRIFMGNPAIR